MVESEHSLHRLSNISPRALITFLSHSHSHMLAIRRRANRLRKNRINCHLHKKLHFVAVRERRKRRNAIESCDNENQLKWEEKCKTDSQWKMLSENGFMCDCARKAAREMVLNLERLGNSPKMSLQLHRMQWRPTEIGDLPSSSIPFYV